MNKVSSYKLSIIIVNYNGERFLEGCFQSILEKCHDLDHEVVLVDNDSADNSVDFIKSNYPWVKLIESNENLGFSAGNNLAVKNSSGEYILLLNNDTVLLDDLNLIIDQFDKESMGILSAKMLGRNNEFRNSAGKFPSPLSMFKLSNMYHTPDYLNVDNTQAPSYLTSVDWVEGSFMLTTRTIWNKVNGMDEDYFMYAEDIDLCKRVKLIGKENFYFSGLSYIHFGGYNAAREGLLKTGLLRYNNKFHSTPKKVLCELLLMINFGVKRVKKSVKNIFT